MKASSDYLNPATKVLDKGDQKDDIKIVENISGGAATATGIKEKGKSGLQLSREHGITLNPAKLRISKTIEVGGFIMKSKNEESTRNS